MKTFSKILASSVAFDVTTPAISTSVAATTAQFGTQGALGGPLVLNYGIGVAMQANIGQVGSTSAIGGTFSILGSNVLEKPMFKIVATTTVSSSGSWLLRDSAPWYKYVDFQFIPVIAGSSGVLTVILNEKANS